MLAKNIFGVVTFEWTNYLRPYDVTLKNGKTEKNLQHDFIFNL